MDVPAVKEEHMLINEEIVKDVLKALLSLVSQFNVFVNLSAIVYPFHLRHSNLIHSVYNGGNLILYYVGVK